MSAKRADDKQPMHTISPVSSLVAVVLLSTTQLHAQAPGQAEPRTLEKLVAVSVDDEGATPIGSAASTKSDVPLIETPQAISVISAETIKERNITKLADALRGVAGVSRSSTYGYYDAYTIRGYDAAYGSVFLDGLTFTSSAGTNNELAGLEQVEVVKGPASALFGASPLGGVVNLVSKRPHADNFVDANIATGSYNLIETSIDANATLNDDESLLARLNVLYRDSDDFVDFSGENRVFVAPALTWKIADKTRLTLLARYQRDHDNPWSPLTAYGTLLPSAHGELPIDFSVNRGGSQRSVHNQERKQIGYALDHEFNDALTFSQNARYGKTKAYWNNWIFSDNLLDSAFVNGIQQGHLLGLLLYGPFSQSDDDFGIDNRLKLKFDTGAINHSVLFGVDYKRNANTSADSGSNFFQPDNTLDILAPDYSAALIHDPTGAYTASSKSRQIGYYVQDHIGFADKVYVTLGGRWDLVDADGQKDHAFSPNVGVNYFVTPTVSLYANWSRPFTPQFGWVTTFDGEQLPPETGRNIELGVKIGDADSTFNGLVSAFQLTRQNVATADPDPTHMFFYVVTGEQRSRGIELEGGWNPAPGVKLSLAYSYIEAVVTHDTSIPVGTELSNIPKHNFYAYGQYVVQHGALENLGVNLSLLYSSEKNNILYIGDINGDGINEPTVALPSYLIVDAGVSYKLMNWNARLALNNALNKRYYPDANDLTRVSPGEPRNWRLSLSRKFEL